MIDRPLIAITLGDPSGIGAEVVVKALADPAVHASGRLFVIGDALMPRNLSSAVHDGYRIGLRI